MQPTLEPEVESLLKEQEEKYFELVHYGRAVCGMDGFEPYKTDAPDTSVRYPKEVAELRSDYSNWAHAFNSGCLAMVRLIMSATEPEHIEDRIQGALDEFPFLDT